MKNQQELAEKLAINFKNQKLLTLALIHRSYLNEADPTAKLCGVNNQKLASNERLEFLGDAILSFIVSDWLFEQFPYYPEGKLTNLRSNLVKTSSLAKIAKRFEVGEYLFLSKGEKESGGQQNPSLLANTLEAIIAAIFLDQGSKIVNQFIRKNFRSLLGQLIKSGEFKDYKSLLQEKLQAKTKEPPIYKVVKAVGPDHAKIFTVAVHNQNKSIATGQGKSKQMAEEKAAQNALEKLASE